MTSPVTSTKVATKGAEEDAGSKPNRWSTKGSVEPDPAPGFPLVGGGRGRAAGIVKPFSHLTIVVRERAEAEDK
jgi:hypothetical protein